MMSPRRLFPRLSYTNFHKQYPNLSKGCFSQWFSVQRFWYGRLITINVKHHSVTLDFRGNWLEDIKP